MGGVVICKHIYISQKPVCFIPQKDKITKLDSREIFKNPDWWIWTRAGTFRDVKSGHWTWLFWAFCREIPRLFTTIWGNSQPTGTGRYKLPRWSATPKKIHEIPYAFLALISLYIFLMDCDGTYIPLFQLPRLVFFKLDLQKKQFWIILETPLLGWHFQNQTQEKHVFLATLFHRRLRFWNRACCANAAVWHCQFLRGEEENASSFLVEIGTGKQ